MNTWLLMETVKTVKGVRSHFTYLKAEDSNWFTDGFIALKTGKFPVKAKEDTDSTRPILKSGVIERLLPKDWTVAESFTRIDRNGNIYIELKSGDISAIANPRFIYLALKAFPNAELGLVGDKAPIAIVVGGEVVGAIMPINLN
jgi:hypothetical protein